MKLIATPTQNLPNNAMPGAEADAVLSDQEPGYQDGDPGDVGGELVDQVYESE